jgi:hypothetical protein
MPRHNRRVVPVDPVPRSSAHERRERWHDDDYVVRAVPGASAVKTYRCPGCDHEVRPGVAHVVTWRADDPDATHRRHWHTACWAARENRRPTRRG